MTGYHAIPSSTSESEKRDSQLLLLLIFSFLPTRQFSSWFLMYIRKLHYILCNISSFLGSSCHTKHKMILPLSYHQRRFMNLPTSWKLSSNLSPSWSLPHSEVCGYFYYIWFCLCWYFALSYKFFMTQAICPLSLFLTNIYFLQWASVSRKVLSINC